jgi:hypothetical protein
MSSGDDAEERLTRLSAAGVGDKSLGRFGQRPHRQLWVDQGTVGGTNSYSTISDDVSPDAPALAGMFATHAAIALWHAHERETLKEAC